MNSRLSPSSVYYYHGPDLIQGICYVKFLVVHGKCYLLAGSVVSPRKMLSVLHPIALPQFPIYIKRTDHNRIPLITIFPAL